jgi:chemosensory pili system protein ChpA (sensor histidine kinase/response regulator)
MDIERQIRLNFLDEAEEYFDLIESNLLGLGNNSVDTQQLDLMLRSAHSVKGGAAMMEFPVLSRVAHRLEDFFKILRLRYASLSVNLEVETLMLRGLDCLRQISNCYRQGLEFEDSWLNEQVDPIFESLHQHLGELQDADEDALMAQDEDVDPALLVFEEGVDIVLDRFEELLSKLDLSKLSQELATTAKELIAFGEMANLENFSQLCRSIQQQAEIVTQDKVESLAQRALTTWRRSHALVMRGRVEKLPSQLEGVEVVAQDIQADFPRENADFSEESEAWSNLDGFDGLDFSAVQAELANFAEVPSEEFLAEVSSDLGDLTELQAAFKAEVSYPPEIELDGDPLVDVALDLENLSELQAAFNREISASSLDPENTQLLQLENNSLSKTQPLPPQGSNSVGKMVRVPLEQLKQFNELFEKLILERNRINLHLKQTQNLAALMRQRMQQIEQSNTQLKKWYDRASLEGIVPTTEESVPTLSSPLRSISTENLKEQFDALEMDRYSDLHLICQEQIETVVQLQEVSTDIELELQEMNQAVRYLNQTTKSLQGNVTRTQMLPFAEVIKRFPRVVRELSLQFGKQVNLKIEGENTLIDRSILETLSDPLLHLLRNAFDHGIEEPAIRIAAGKSPEGTIMLQAMNKGTQTVITLRDDGAGIPVEKIRARLRSLGIPSEHIDQMSHRELLDYIFEPGFSTAEKVTELSGRGVGMDVVRTNLTDIRAEIQVQTQPGLGTTFTLRLPFTLSILRVMIVEQSGFVFAIPVSSVREILPFQSEQITSREDGEQLSWNGQTIPLVRLEQHLVFRRDSRIFKMTGNPAIAQPVTLIVGEGNQFTGIHLSRFWCEQEATIRPIASPIPLPSGFVSSVILGDGRVIPLIEPLDLIAECLRAKSREDNTQTTVAVEDLPLSCLPNQSQTILVVDDSITVRRYLGLTLEKAGYQVEQAKDGREAVDKLIGGLSVQAVICDIEMPRLDGYGVLEELKGKSEFQDLPIAMLTSRSNEKHRKLAMNLGASAYFSKPYNEQELLQSLAQLLSGAGGIAKIRNIEPISNYSCNTKSDSYTPLIRIA